MEILNRNELLNYDKTTLGNLYSVSEQWLVNDFINQNQYNDLIKKIKYLNYKHHNEANFEKNFIELFSIEKDGKRITHTLDRANMGANFGGIRLSENNILFTETAEMGIIILFSNFLNKKEVEESIQAIDFLMYALEDPFLGKRQMEVLKNKTKLEDNLVLKKEEKRVKI